MTVTIGAPSIISVTSTAENQYTVTSTAQSGITATISIPNKGDKGDKGDPGIFIPAGTDKMIQYNDGGVLGSDSDLKWDKNTSTLRIGIDDDSPLPDNPLAMVGHVDSYLQASIKNTSETADASSDFVATADNGTDEAYYLDMGINSSVYDALGDASSANDSYVWANGGDLFLVSETTGKEVKIVSGGGGDADIVASFSSSGLTMYPNKTINQRPEIYYGTGSPPSATGLADGTLFIKYTP